MATTTLIARLELTLLLRNGVATALLLSFAALTIAAAAAGVLRVARHADDRAVLSVREPDDRTQGLAYYAFERGTFAVLPPPPLAGFAVGQSDVHAAHYHITARLKDAQLVADQLEHPLVLYAGTFDVLFVLLYLYPLLIIGISHDLLASERANGTLRMLLVQGATLGDVVRGRVLTRLLLVILLPAAASLLTAAAVDITMAWSPRFIVWTAAAIFYGVFWLGLALHVTARGASAASNAMTLTAAWLLFVILLPAVLNLTTRVVFQVPSGVQLAIAMREAAREAIAEGSRTLGRYLEDHPSTGAGEEGLRQFYMLQDLRDAEVARRLQPVLTTHERQRARQAGLVSFAQYVSPTIVAQLALTDLAGTSGHRARAFADQAGAFQEDWKSRFPADVLAADEAPLPALPAFAFAEEPFWTVAGRTTPSLAALAAGGVALLWSGGRRCRRLDIPGS